jgi:MarR family 2-MHQ and catechol resistance regulon transcriptional repressor
LILNKDPAGKPHPAPAPAQRERAPPAPRITIQLQLTTICSRIRVVSPLTLAPETAENLLAGETKAFQDALAELVRLYQFRDRDRICCYDVSVSQCYALEVLVQRGEKTLNELAAHLYLDKSTASRVVDALERKGYVDAAPHPTDRRALLLRATASGRDLYHRIESDLLAETEQLLAGFTPEVRSGMLQLLTPLTRAAARRVDASGGSCCRIS